MAALRRGPARSARLPSPPCMATTLETALRDGPEDEGGRLGRGQASATTQPDKRSGESATFRTRHKVRLVTATSLFDGHDASINIMRRIAQAAGAEIIHLGHNRSAWQVA